MNSFLHRKLPNEPTLMYRRFRIGGGVAGRYSVLPNEAILRLVFLGCVFDRKLPNEPTHRRWAKRDSHTDETPIMEFTKRTHRLTRSSKFRVQSSKFPFWKRQDEQDGWN